MPAITAHTNRLALAGYRPETIRSRAKCLTTFAAFIHPHPLAEATREQIEAYLARPLAPESRRTYRAHLRGYFGYLLDEGLITADPTAKVPAIRVPRALPRPISGADLTLALDNADPRMRAWLLLMALGGLRCLEVAHLRPRDLLVTEGGTLLYLRECKGGGSATVPAHPAILDALAVLPIRDGLWWDLRAHSVSVAVNTYLRSLGVAATAHALRHSAGTAWYRASGHDIIATAGLLRHASIRSSQTYAQLDPTRLAEVVRLVELPA